MFALRLAQTMSMPLSELVKRMSSREFGLHLALAMIDNAPRAHGAEAPTADELEWFGGAN